MSIENTTVRALIERPTVDVNPDATLRQVAEILAEDYIGVAVVRSPPAPPRRGTHAGGLISERDIVRALAEGADPDEEIAENVMTLDLVSLPPGANLAAVAECMVDNEIRHVPVIDDGLVVGVVSERDMLRALLDERRA